MQLHIIFTAPLAPHGSNSETFPFLVLFRVINAEELMAGISYHNIMLHCTYVGRNVNKHPK